MTQSLIRNFPLQWAQHKCPNKAIYPLSVAYPSIKNLDTLDPNGELKANESEQASKHAQ